MISLNLQPIEKQSLRSDGMLDIHSVWVTVQGEGPFVGTPAVFIRTAGCCLLCPGCDTDYTQGRILWKVQDLVSKVRDLAGKVIKLVVITGGEPFRQGLGSLVDLLLGMGFKVQIETNGTLFDPTMLSFYSRVMIICSPKSAKVDARLSPYIHHFKYILSAGDGMIDPLDGLPMDSLGTGVRPARPGDGFRGDIFLQPCDDGDEVRNQANIKAVVDSCLEYGYRMCLQMHKIVGLP